MAKSGQKLRKITDRPDWEAQLILAQTLNKDRAWLLAHGNEKISDSRFKIYDLRIKRRLKGEPLAYVLGEQEFYGLPFKVNKNVLIPRPETEMMVSCYVIPAEAGIQVKKRQPYTNGNNKTIIIDIGAGSGAIIVAIASEIKRQKAKGKNKNQKSKLFGIDISNKALTVAKQNAKLNKVDKQITFLKGNLLEPFLCHCEESRSDGTTWQSRNRSDKHRDRHAPIAIGARDDKIIIIANLPYLKNSLPGLTKSQKRDLSFEPRQALLAGADGLKHYRQLAKQVQQLLKLYPRLNLTLYLEADPDQMSQLKKLFGFAKNISIKKDFRNLNRLCIIMI